MIKSGLVRAAAILPEVLPSGLFDEVIKPEDIGYTHPVFLQCFLPTRHSARNKQRWQTNCGRASLVIRAGELANPDKPNEYETCLIPAGPKARFVIAYVNDYIQRENTPTVNMGDTLRDAMQKMRVGMGIAPLVNAMFANSSVSEGGLNRYMSYRGHIWTDTDNARCGLLPFVFRDGAGFADYVEWALDVPLYFILRGGRYVTEVTGVPFRRFLAEGAAGQRATLDDWNLHLTTLFPEVRLKGYIELRSADSQPPERMLALPALVKGVFYTADCLDAAWDLVKRWSFEERVQLWREAHREALLARFRGVKVLELARELFGIAEEGLRRQRALDESGRDERVYLERLGEQLEMGRSPARVIAEKWTGEWDRRVERLIDFAEYRA